MNSLSVGLIAYGALCAPGTEVRFEQLVNQNPVEYPILPKKSEFGIDS